MLIEYRFRVHDGNAATLAAFRAATGGAALVVSSVRGDTLPYLVGEPKGDGASIDPTTGRVKSAVYAGQIADGVTATSPSVLRVFTSQLEDASHRQQLGNRLAAFDVRTNGGAWTTLTIGLLTRFQQSSDIVWDVTVSDPTQSEHGRQTFCPQIDPATGQLETVAQFLTRWPSRGCVFGGPIRGGFLNQPDRNGWEMVVDSRDNSGAGGETYLRFVAGYAPPNFKRSLDAQECAAAANAKTDSLLRGAAGTQAFSYSFRTSITTFEDANAGPWPDVVIEMFWGSGNNGLFQPTTGIFYSLVPGSVTGDEWKHLIKDIRYRGLYIKTGALGVGGVPAEQTRVFVRGFTAHVSEVSPIYWTGHPVDLLTTLWLEAGIAFDSASTTALKNTIGANWRIALRITAPQDMGTFLEQVIYGPFGIGVRVNGSGLLEVFATRIFNSTPPTLTIDNTKAPRGASRPFLLDTSTSIRSVTIEHDRLVLTQNSGNANDVDGFSVQHETVERINNDPGALGTESVSYRIPGMVFVVDPANPTVSDPNLPQFTDLVASEIFDRTGRGLITGSTTVIRGTDVAAAKLGEEVLVNLKQLPNRNQRLGDNAAIAARAMQIVRMTPHRTGNDLELADSGPNAQPFATVPTLSMAASADSPRRVALLTITNAATLNTANAAVRIRMALGATSPLSTDYAPVLYYGPGQIPTGAIAMPGVPSGSTVWAIARAEVVGSRPSNYSVAAHVALTGLTAPSALTATPAADDASLSDLAWTPGETGRGIETDVFVRLASEASSSNVRRAALEPGSSRYTLEHLVAGQAYTATVQHRDTATGDTSAAVTVNFTTTGATVTLDSPTNPNGFSGTQDPRYGLPQQDGVYGLAVAATEFPGFSEFVEEVETAPGSGIYGAPATIGKIANVQGDWTIWQGLAPNDGKQRQLSARQVRDGATSSGYTTGVVVRPWTPQALGRFSDVVGADGILRVSSTESSDGTQREFKVVLGALVDTLHVHYRTVPINEAGDAFDFSGDEDVSVSPSLMILRRPSDGVVTFAIAHPARQFKVAGRLVPLGRAPAFKAGASWPFAVDAAPPAINAKIHPARVGALASLSIDIAFGSSDADASGVPVDVIEDSLTTSTTILSKRVTAPTTLDSVSDPVLGNRALPPGKDSLAWRVRITDVSGQPWWFGPASANRDPLPNGQPAVKNYRGNPAIVCPFDPDTDQIRYTAHDGRTKTYNAAALLAGSPITYAVGDALDDASTEAVLAVDETRSGAKIEYQGGGQWVTMWTGDLHGQPSNPPTADVRKELNAARDGMAVFVRPDTQVSEKLHVYWRDGSTDTALEWIACAGAADPTALQVVAGTQLGPSNFFRRVDGVGSPQAKLSGISLVRDQIAHYGTMIEGVDSGIQSPWLDVILSLMEKPWLSSHSAEWDEASGKLLVRLKGGAHCASVFVEASSASNFSAPLTAASALVDGADIVVQFSLSAAQRGKTWYVRATPWNGWDSLASAVAGLDGVGEIDQAAVPALFDLQVSTTEAAGQGTVTLTLTDGGSVFDRTWTNGTITGAISWEIIKNGVKTVEASTTQPGSGTTGVYTKTIALVDHIIQVNAFGHLIDGSTAPLGSWGFDSNKISDVVNATVANSGVNATVTIDWDTDTLVGANCARYSLDNGVTWTSTVTVSSALLSQVTVTRISTKQTMLVQAKNALDGNWGDQATVEIDAYISDSPSLTVTPTPGTTSYSIAWSGTGTITLSIDGGSYGTPSASPISVTRTSADHTYAFKSVQAGVTTIDTVTVPSLEKDTVTPDLTVTPGTPAATTQPYTATAGNPSGGTAPSLSVTCTGCTMTISGTTYSDGTTQTIASGTVVTANRPASTTTTQAKLKFDAAISGGGLESIVIDVTPQLNTGPSLNVTPTPGSSSYSIAWSGTGTITVSIDGASYGTPSASPITVTRDSSDHTYAFKAVADGQTIQSVVTVPALGSTGALSGTFSSLTNTLHDTATDTIDFGWAWSGGSVTFEVYVRDVGRFGDALYHYHTTTSAGATTYRYTAGEDITTNISPTVVIGFSLRALSSSTYGPSSVTTEATYGTV